MFSLSEKVGLVVGVANERSIAWAHAVCLAKNGTRNVTGGVHCIDGGYSITG